MDNRPHYHSAIYWLKQYTQQYAKVFIQLHSVIRKQTRVKLDKKHGYEQVTSEYVCCLFVSWSYNPLVLFSTAP